MMRTRRTNSRRRRRTAERAAGIALAAVLPLLALAACGGDDGTGPGGEDDLSAEEVEEMTEALAAAGAFAPAFGVPTFSPPAGSAAREPVSMSIDQTVSCPQGGSIGMSGNLQGDYDDETGEGAFNLAISQDYMDCVSTAESSGRTFTFGGGMDMDLDMEVSQNSFSMDGTNQGTLQWSTSGRSGSCSVNVSYQFSGSETSFTGQVSGTVCGVDVSQDLSMSI